MNKETDPLKQIDKMVRELIKETGSLKIKLREVSDNHRKFTMGLLLEILELGDSFDQLFEKKNKITEGNVRALHKLLKRIIKNSDLVKVRSDPGDIVDADIHHIIETEINEKSDKITIIKTLKPGYIWKGDLLRPAEVKVFINENNS